MLDPQSQLSQQLLEAKPFPLVVARGVVRLRPEAVKQSMRFLCGLGGHSGTASDVTHENIPPPSVCHEGKGKTRADLV